MRGKVPDPRTGDMKEVDKRVEAASAKEAAGLRDDLLQQTIRASHTERMRVVDFAKSWIESKAAVVSRYTLEGYTSALDLHVYPYLGKFYFDTVGHLEVQGMVNEWLAEKKTDGSRRYSKESLKDWFRVFRNMTQDAIVQLHLERDPTLRVSFGEEVVEESDAKDGDKLTIDECHLLLEAMRTKRPGSFALLTTKKYTGQRFCHVSALKIGDIDWAEMVVRFRRKQVRGVVGPISKKKPVPKEMPMVSELAYVLLAHCRRLGNLDYPVDPDAWLFPSRNGKLKQPSSLVTAIRESAKDAQLTKRITPHMMRYLFNDVLRLAGVDKVTRKALTGHVTDEMTEHYSTVGLDEKRTAMEAAAAKLREVEVGTSVGTTLKKTKAA
ncbi:MAG TPA: tyrosine-type recombinase/integrase [Polyangia bacterium]